MIHCTKGFMAEKLRQYSQSNLYSLNQCYLKHSNAKNNAFSYCLNLMRKYKGTDLRILSYNTFHFSVGFIGEYEGQKAFFYITPNYDRYILIN